MHNFPWFNEINNENVFYYNLNNGKHFNKVKGYIVIRFYENYIRFYWKNNDYIDLTFPENQHVFSIDLSTNKTIGDDLLNINEEYIKSNVPVTIKLDDRSIIDFIYEFVSELENDKGVFISSPITNTVIVKLRSSTIYKLLVAKKRHATYTAHRIGLDPYEYNRIVSEYADMLMSPKITNIIPSDKVGKGRLFENPEYELQLVMSINEDISKANKDRIKGICKSLLNKSVRKKIQSFFFLKHSTINACYNKKWRNIYCGLWIFMLLWIIAFISISVYTNGMQTIQITKKYQYLICCATLLLITFIVTAVGNRNFNSFYPRVIIALISSWMLIVLSGDFVFSLLYDYENEGIVIVILLLAVIVSLIFGAKAHSVYYCTRQPIRNFIRKYNLKVLPIFSCSLFLSFCLGILIQGILFRPLLEKSGVLYSTVFYSSFRNIEFHTSQTRLLIQSVEAYRTTTKFLNLPANNINVKFDTIRNTVEIHFQQYINHPNCDPDLTEISKKDINQLYSLLNKQYKAHENFVNKHQNINNLLFLCYGSNDEIKCKIDKTIRDIYFKESCEKQNIIYLQICNKEYYLFPTLLIIHSLIALFIAFAIQIIFTGKSITEKL